MQELTVLFLTGGPSTVCCSLIVSLYSLREVSGQQILEGSIKEFWMDFIIALRLVVHIHAYGKSNLKVQKAWIPDCLSFINIYIYIYFSKGICFFFISVHHIFIYLFIYSTKLKQG